MITACVFVIMVLANIGLTQETEAGPFLRQGHWVETIDGGRVCATHWWLNRCIIDQDEEG
ncbi:hypothetical protein [Algoriphagus namhaensis]